MASAPRRVTGVLLTLVLAVLALGVTAGPAGATAGYRYWNYFHVKGTTYVFAQTGASDYTPPDGSTEAYRYGTSTTSKGLAPRADLSTYTAAKICAGVTAPAGRKRVGVLLDYGTKADATSGTTPPAPRAACAVVPTKANGQQVLSAVAKVRYDKFTCGIDGYPVTTCSVTVKAPGKPASEKPVAFTLPKAATTTASSGTSAASSTSDPSTTSDSGGSNKTLLVVGVVVLLLLAGGGFALTRRNRSA